MSLWRQSPVSCQLGCNPPLAQSGSVMTTVAPALRQASAMRSSSVATTTKSRVLALHAWSKAEKGAGQTCVQLLLLLVYQARSTATMVCSSLALRAWSSDL